MIQPDNACIRAGQIFAVKHMVRLKKLTSKGGNPNETATSCNRRRFCDGAQAPGPRRGSGLGKTSGKGHKGAKAPLRRPASAPDLKAARCLCIAASRKRGFNNIFAVEYACVNVERLEIFNDGV